MIVQSRSRKMARFNSDLAGSGVAACENSLDELGSGTAFKEGQKFDTAAVREDNVTFGNKAPASGSVVFALAVNIRLNAREHWRGLRIIEQSDIVDGFERSDDFHAIFFWNERPQSALNCADASIAVQTDDQNIAQCFGCTQAPNVPGVKKIEAAVGPDDDLTPALPLGSRGDERIDGSEFGRGDHLIRF